MQILQLYTYLAFCLATGNGFALHYRSVPPSGIKAPPQVSRETTESLLKIMREKILGDNEAELGRYLSAERDALLALEAQLEANEMEFACEAAIEAHFYSSVSSCIQQSTNGFDPFRICKYAELVKEDTMSYISDISTKLLDFTDETYMAETLTQVIELSLWGTRDEVLELSPKPELSAAEKNAAAFGNNPEFAVPEEKKRRITPSMKKAMFSNVLQDNRRFIQRETSSMDVDSVSKVVNFLIKSRGEGGGEAHIVTDKVGHGLISDLLLGHILLSLGICSFVNYHCRPYSSGSVLSATSADVSGTIEQMADPTQGGDLWNVRHFGEALRRHVVTGEMRIEEDEFWCDIHVPMSEMPDHLADRFRGAVCTFVKGDSSYHRMLGDVDWPEGSPAQDMLSYWPSPLCILRTRGAHGSVTLVEEY